jgi:hypothetical protein
VLAPKNAITIVVPIEATPRPTTPQWFFVVSLSECSFCFDAVEAVPQKPWANGLTQCLPGALGIGLATLSRFLKRLRYKVEFGSIGFVSSSTPAAKAASW